MKEELDIRWINESDCNGTPHTIGGVDTNEKILFLVKDLNGELCKMSYYGKNKNFLINTISPNTEDWITKKIRIRQDIIAGKNIRTIY